MDDILNPEEIPQNVRDAAKLVGMYFLMNNIKEWALGPCASRQQIESLQSQLAASEAREKAQWVVIESTDKQLAAERERADGLQRVVDAANLHEWAPTGLIVGSSYQWRCWKCKAEALTEDQAKPNAGDCCLPSPVPAQPAVAPEGYVTVEIGYISDRCLAAAKRDATIVKAVTDDDNAIFSAAINAYLLAAANFGAGVKS